MSDEDTKPIRNYKNERCVFCGAKTVILFHHLRWCPDCEKKEKNDWVSLMDEALEYNNTLSPLLLDVVDRSFKKELQKFRDSFKVSRCTKHNAENCAMAQCITNE